jgi:hypothetical protein
LQVRGSTDGRYEEVDRPVVSEGRFASGNREVFVADDYRSALEAIVGHRVGVGDTIEMAFWWAAAEEVGSLWMHPSRRSVSNDFASPASDASRTRCCPTSSIRVSDSS